MKDLVELKDVIQKHLKPGVKIGIMTHIEPDGDGFCASLALQRFLRSRGLTGEVIIDPASHLDRFGFLLEDAILKEYSTPEKYDLLFILDCNSYNRIGERRTLVEEAEYVILIDHHVPENGIIVTDYSCVDVSAVSVGAILWRVFQPEICLLADKDRIPILNNLYVTILNDTNNFTNANTNAEVFDISKDLAQWGISPSRLYKEYFLNHEPLEMRYIGEVLSTIELHHDDQTLFMMSTLEMQHRNRLTADAIMNITRWVQGVKGVKVIAYLREEQKKLYKLSLRSPVLDVNSIASSYGGGGHRSASGADVKGDISVIKPALLHKLQKALETLGTNV